MNKKIRALYDCARWKAVFTWLHPLEALFHSPELSEKSLAKKIRCHQPCFH